MDTKYKKHQRVKLLRPPIEDDIEPYTDPPTDINTGMEGRVNLILPNGQYHIEVFDKEGKTIAYIAIDEDSLEPIQDPKGLKKVGTVSGDEDL